MKKPQARLDKSRQKSIQSALVMGYSIAELCQAIDGCALTPFNMGQNEQSLMAWIKVTKAMRQAGVYKTVIFDDAMIHAVIADLGGWVKLCGLSERELNFQQREFERLYAYYLQHPIKAYPRQLSGIISTANAASGHQFQSEPVLIGDISKAALVYKNGQEYAALSSQSLSIQKILQLAENQLLLESKIHRRALPKKQGCMGEENDD